MDSRVENSKRNIVWGIVHRFISIIFPFILRSIIINKLSVEYVGLGGLFSSLLTFLSVSELGFESAVAILLYKPIANDNKEETGALLNFLRKVYIYVGSFIAISGLFLMPFLDSFIKDTSEIPSEINIYIIYLISLCASSFSYFFGGYRQTQLVAFQRNDIISKVFVFCTVFFSFLQIVVLETLRSYYAYLLLNLACTICTNVIILVITRKLYSYIQIRGTVKKEQIILLKKYILGSSLARLGALLCTTLDNIVISSFLGIYILGLYTNYSYIITGVLAILVVIFKSIQGSIGNSIAKDSIDKNRHDLNVLNFGYNWLLIWFCYCCAFLIQPFIVLWLGEDYLLPNYIIAALVLFLYSSESVSVVNVYKYAAGILWEDWYRPLVMGSFNLILNLTIVYTLSSYNEKLALIGVLLSSIIAYCIINNPWIVYITFKLYFKEGIKDFLSIQAQWFIALVVLITISYPLFDLIPITNGLAGYLNMVLRLVICIILPNIVLFGIYGKNKYLIEFKGRILKI